MKDNLSHRSYFIPFITVSWAITVGSSRMWLGNSDWFWLSGCSWKIPIGQDHLEMICFSIAMLNYRGIPSPWKSHWNPMEISSKPHSTPIKIPSNPIKSHYIRIDITLTYYWTSIQSIFFLDGFCQKKTSSPNLSIGIRGGGVLLPQCFGDEVAGIPGPNGAANVGKLRCVHLS